MSLETASAVIHIAVPAISPGPAPDMTMKPAHLKQIRAVDPRVRITSVSHRTKWLEEAPETEVILGFRPLRDAALKSRRLRWVHAAGAGVERLCQDVAGTDIIVTNSHIHGDPISEHVFGMLLSLARRLPEFFQCQEQRRWARHDRPGTLLAGRTMGVLGLGTLGVAVAKRAAAFGMRVVGTKRTPAPVPHVDRVFPSHELDEVLRMSDAVVVTLPYTAETKGLIGARELALLPPGAFVINVGRGGIIDEAALVAALRSGRLGGAGSDVFDQEPLPEDSPLWDTPRLIITSHCAGAFEGYMDRVVPLFCENLRRYLAGRPLLNVVDVSRGY
jgi:phosphoglycerate dehydrogenase-like enzyme